MSGSVSDKTTVRLPIAVFIGMGIALVSSTITMFTVAYGQREALMQQVRAERVEALKHYVSEEEFLAWRGQERIRQDEQYFSLLESVKELEAVVEHKR